MRCFIAINYNAFSDYFRKSQNLIFPKDVTFVSSFHLTLKFLGDVKKEHLKLIIEKLKKINFSSFTLDLSRYGEFVYENKPKIIWVGLKENEELKKLHEKIESCLYPQFKRETRFFPHITLARIKNSKTDSNIKSLSITSHQIEEAKSMKINSFELVESILTKTGPKYLVLAEFELN